MAAVEAGAEEVIRAYEDIGMRVSYSFALRDQAPANLHWCSDAALESGSKRLITGAILPV